MIQPRSQFPRVSGSRKGLEERKKKKQQAHSNHIVAKAQIYIGIFIESASCELTARAV